MFVTFSGRPVVRRAYDESKNDALEMTCDVTVPGDCLTAHASFRKAPRPSGSYPCYSPHFW